MGIFFSLLFAVCELEIQRKEASYTSCGQQSEHLQSLRGGQRDLPDTCMHILGTDYFLKHFFLIRPNKTIQVIISMSIVLCYFIYGSNLYSIFLQSFLVDLLVYIVCIL